MTKTLQRKMFGGYEHQMGTTHLRKNFWVPGRKSLVMSQKLTMDHSSPQVGDVPARNLVMSRFPQFWPGHYLTFYCNILWVIKKRSIIISRRRGGGSK